MNFQEYQDATQKTAIYPSIGQDFVYPVLGMVGEAGEVAEKVKKIARILQSKSKIKEAFTAWQIIDLAYRILEALEKK